MSILETKINSLIEFFYHWEKTQPDKIFLRQPKGDHWHTLTYAQAGNEARKMTNALRKKGLVPGDHVGILSKNCYHWILADLAIMMGGFVSVPYYASLPKKQLEQVIGLSDLKAIFVGKLEEWGDKSEAIPDYVSVIKFPHYEGNAKIDIGEDWNELIKNNEPVTDQLVPNGEDLWTIKFTSGTTGTPKGVMLKHQSPVDIIQNEYKTNWIGIKDISEVRCLSFLPLNHVGERIGLETSVLGFGGMMSFAESIDTFAQNLKDTQPTLFFAVPRIWTKFYLGVLSKFPKKRLELLFKIPFVSNFIKKKIRYAIGMGDIQIAATGAAITPAFIKEFYKELGIHLVEAYGMTEVCGSFTNSPDPNSPSDSVGKVVPFAEVKIDEESGEILMKSPYMMTGYYKNPEKTAEIMRDGWLHSGDRGTLDKEGYLRVIGRVKDAFKTSKGSYITPNPMEEILMENDFIEQVCVAGIGMPQPMALINLSEIGMAEEKEIVENSILESVQKVNDQGAKFEKISTAIIDKKIWSEENGFLTPTLKVKRWRIDEQYSNQYSSWHEASEKIIWM